MAYRKLKIILDADDVLLDCNGYALSLLSAKDGKRYSKQDITGWGILGSAVDERMQFFNEESFYRTQPALPGAEEFFSAVKEKAEVFIMTAVYPEFMGYRIARLMELFPDLDPSNIIMGQRKDLLNADIMLDDRIDNLLASNCTLPVLFRQPWNGSATGLCRVSNYSEFLTIIDFLNGDKSEISLIPKVVCIVGPSGSRKQELADAICQNPLFEKVRTYTTSRSARAHSNVIEMNYFGFCVDNHEFLEHTHYNGECYGTKSADIERILRAGRHAVVVMDISGCMAVYNRYPGRCHIYYINRNMRSCVVSILEKKGLSKDQLADRIMALSLEQKNMLLADSIINIDMGIASAANTIMSDMA